MSAMPPVDIRGCRTRAELEEVVNLLERAFPDTEREYFERHVLDDRTLQPDDTRILIRNGRLLSSVQIFPRRVRIGDRHVLCGGIGNVATDTGARGAGLASMVMQDAIDQLRARRVPMAMLTTTLNGYYERFGFTTVERQLFTIADVAGDAGPGIRRFAITDLPEVRAIYDEYNDGNAGSVVRDDSYWHAQLDFCGEDRDKFLVLERAGRVEAYIRSVVRKGRLSILEFGARADIPTAFDGLLGATAALAPNLPVTMHLSERDSARIGLRPPYAVSRDTDLMVAILDDSVRDLVESRLTKPKAMTFWLSDFF